MRPRRNVEGIRLPRDAAAAIYRIKLNITSICLADSDYSLGEGGRARVTENKKITKKRRKKPYYA